ncbi:MAG: apolipoprotein N-acyltransferase [Erythrobacter sp.]
MTEYAKALDDVAQRRPGLVALVLGLLAACGYPPLHLWPLGLAALAALVWHLHRAPHWRTAAWRGYVFGWAHLTLANNWIATAFTHQAKMPELLGWLAVPLLCVYLAVYPGLAALAAYVARRRLSPPQAGIATFGTLFAAFWIVTEWIRSWAFTGYPWPPLGLMLLGSWHSPGIAVVLPWLGTYALSGLAILIAAGFVWILHSESRAGAIMLLAAIVLGMTASPFVHGSRVDTGISYALVQPLIPQDEINDGTKFEEQFQRLARLTRPRNDESRLVLWPESAIPDDLEDGYPLRYYARMTAGADPEYARRRIAAVVGADSTLLTGVVNLDIGTREDGSLGAVSARNSVVAIAGQGDIEAKYAKAHLVPYGEYLPMEWALERLGLARLTAGTIAYVAGPGPRTLELGEHGRAGIQICYEIVFSGQVTDPENRPDYIFNPSNDGWFGSWGPPQHLAQARMRAIEEGLPVLRSTTTGISAVIDANGIVRGSIGIGEAGRLDGFVPKARAPTLFARLGNALPLGCAALLAVLALALPRLLALRRSRG